MKLPIPEIQRQVAPQGISPGPMLREVASPLTEIGRRVEGFAEGRMRVHAQQEAEAERIAEEQRRARNMERVSNARLEWTQQFSERQKTADPEATNFTPSLAKDFDSWLETSTKGIADEREREQFKQMTIPVKEHLLTGGMQFESTQRVAYRKRQIESGADTDAKVALADPSQVFDLVAFRRAAILGSTELGSEQKAALEKQSREMIALNAASTLVDRDPDSWVKRDGKKDPLIGLMDPGHVKRLNDHANALIAQRKSKDMAGRDAEVKAAVKDLDDLRTFVLDGGLVSPDYEARVLPRLMAQPGMGDAASALVKMSRAGAGFGSMPILAQDRTLAAFNPGDPKQAELKKHMEAVNNRQKAAYKENPWAAATQFGRVADSPVQDIQSVDQIPQIIAARLPQMGTVETYAGEPVSPIRPEESTKVQQLLSALPPDRRGEALGKMGSMLNPQQIAKMGEQLAKGDRVTALMLYAGADKTTFGVAVATRIGQGAQALKDKTVKADDQALAGWKAEIAKIVRGSIGSQQDEDAAIEAAYYFRAAMDVEGYTGTVSNEQAVRAILGHVYEKEGVKTLIPKGMDERAFTTKLEAFNADKLSAIAPKFYIRGKEVAPQIVANRLTQMGMRRNSQGAYIPFTNNAAVTLDKEGVKPLTLDIR